MVARQKYTKGASSVGQIIPSRKTLKLMVDIKRKWPKRFDNAKTLFLRDVARFMMREVQKNAPRINRGGVDERYADGLRIGILEEGEKGDVIAIYMNSETFKVTKEMANRVVLYFKPISSSPRWVDVLMKYGPWPTGIVPVNVRDVDVKVIIKGARADEIDALSSRIYENKSKIEAELSAAGARLQMVTNTNYAIGIEVYEDLGHEVLRREFGLDGAAQLAHWRPAFKKTKKYAQKSMAKVMEYIETGNENVFDISEETDRIDMSVIKGSVGFSKEIAPFIK